MFTRGTSRAHSPRPGGSWTWPRLIATPQTEGVRTLGHRTRHPVARRVAARRGHGPQAGPARASPSPRPHPRALLQLTTTLLRACCTPTTRLSAVVGLELASTCTPPGPAAQVPRPPRPARRSGRGPRAPGARRTPKRRIISARRRTAGRHPDGEAAARGAVRRGPGGSR
ncbi:hypothetical protein QJS66_20770 [Kocuria rhizophila]|nr:hypothetical protein QJS66_20770 [Kocuria rhizophila]